jgi:YD repeat-containing protein
MTTRAFFSSPLIGRLCVIALLGVLTSSLRCVEAVDLFKLYYGLQNKSFMGATPSPNAPSFVDKYGRLADMAYTSEQIKAKIAYDLATMAIGIGQGYIDETKVAGTRPGDTSGYALVDASSMYSLGEDNAESNFLYAQKLLSRMRWRHSLLMVIGKSNRNYTEMQYGQFNPSSNTVIWGAVETSGDGWTPWIMDDWNGSSVFSGQVSHIPQVISNDQNLQNNAYRSRVISQVKVMVDLKAGMRPLDTGAHLFFIASHPYGGSGIVPSYSGALIDLSGLLAPIASSSPMILNDTRLPITLPWIEYPASGGHASSEGSWLTVVPEYTVLLNEVGDGPIPPLPDGEPLSCPPKNGLMSRLQSYTLNLPAIHVHTAVDYQMNGPDGECSSCGVTGLVVEGGVRLDRIHRYADQLRQGAFGPGVFSNYDIRLSLWGDGSGGEIWDPQHERPYRLLAPVSGIMSESGQQLKSATMLNDQGQTTSSLAQAVALVARHHDGRQWRFELVQAGMSGASDLQGRLTSVVDRTGFGTTVSYAFPANASLASLGSAARLWEIQGVQDRFGNTMRFTYGWKCGQPVVTSAICPNGSTISYAYDGEIAGLSGVLFPDGTSSQFRVRTDPDSRCVVIDFDDAGASSTHRRKSVGLTTLECADATVNTLWNATNRVLWVRNAAGELTYKRTTMPDGSLLVFEGGGSDGSGTLKRLKLDSAGVLVKTDVARSWSATSGLEAAAWSTVGEYETDVMLRLILTKEASGGSVSYNRGAQSGGITGVTRRDESGTVVAANATERDDFDNPLKHVDENGIITRYQYDDRGLLLTRTEGIILGADGVTEDAGAAAIWSWTYREDGQRASVTDPLGNTTSYTYDAHGRLINEMSPPDDLLFPNNRAVKAFAYDAAGRLATTTDAAGHTVVYSYDSRNRVTEMRYGDGSKDIMTYGSGANANLLMSKTDRDGVVTSFGYDAAGREISRTEGAQAPAVAITTTTSYWEGTDLPQTVIRAGQKTEYIYDTRKRVIETRRWVDDGCFLAERTVFDADDADRINHTIDAYGRRTYFGYDALNRVVRQVRELVVGALPATPDVASLPRLLTSNPAYTITDTVYDAGGQITARIDADGVRTTVAYDAQGRVTATTEAAGTPVAATTATTYDAAGNRIRVTSPRGVRTDMTYTGRNLLATVTEAADTAQATVVRNLTYTLTGKIATETDALGRVTSYAYGACCDRLQTITDPAGYQTSFTYDFVGNRLSVTDGNGLTTTTAYDVLYRPITQTNAAGEVTAMAYDDNLTDGVGLDAVPVVQAALTGLSLGAGADGSATAVTNPKNETAYEIRDGLGRPVVRIDPLGQQTRLTYDTLVEGLVETAQTDALGHVVRARSDGAGRTRVQIDALGNSSQSLYRDGGDQVSQMDAGGLGWSAAYDARHRLVSRSTTRADAVESTHWSYDLDGNRLTETDALGKTESSQYDLRNRRVALIDRLAGVTPLRL